MSSLYNMDGAHSAAAEQRFKETMAQFNGSEFPAGAVDQSSIFASRTAMAVSMPDVFARPEPTPGFGF